MKTTIIMPTIRVPKNLESWVPMLDENDEIIVVGNECTPHNEVVRYLEDLQKRFPVSPFYLHPESESSKMWHIEKHLDVNHTHRRNLALAWALKQGTDLLVTIDDDNYPIMSTWLTGVKSLITKPNFRDVMTSEDGWWNPGELCDPGVVHRGYPLSKWHQPASMLDQRYANDEKIGVVASLWLGDPDISAIERICCDPQVLTIDSSRTVGRGTWAPFDSQSTSITGELAPLMFMWTGVGRYDDIWASYLARAVMDILNVHVTYGMPGVRQNRNPHNLVRDLSDEFLGYRYTDELCDILRGIGEDYNASRDNDEATVIQVMEYFVSKLYLADLKFLPECTIDALRAWMTDLEELHNAG